MMIDTNWILCKSLPLVFRCPEILEQKIHLIWIRRRSWFWGSYKFKGFSWRPRCTGKMVPIKSEETFVTLLGRKAPEYHWNFKASGHGVCQRFRWDWVGIDNRSGLIVWSQFRCKKVTLFYTTWAYTRNPPSHLDVCGEGGGTAEHTK